MNEKTVLDNSEIQKILPHRYPFLLVDKIIYLNVEENEIIGIKTVSVNEPFFQGHFPSYHIMPGVLILEAMAQTGGILVHQKGFHDKIAFLLNISDAKFRNPVLPGDVLKIHAQCIHLTSKGGKIFSKAIVNENIAAEATICYVLIDKNKL
ncbi:MAG: 3-hydroxyacyl-[acyl-carrier-protein] dehydratase FabZ [Chlamydiae bacterium RIFCSPHIGHO2_12_FULL_27_8]|nr:MAG: 3-hydroxyacyl-[acyl-carrier-protein] dehydratase FabZ [Chlamydiae bacterium RIFCSPHIGHO2_12_FULL_27_8]OGN64910.1 MAG: 3-hydroxyacyl-[acyl-carrier-protein] dehydratase FabZ [Chlamydiae bacterium RIFCSPLOWO2_01_FULL_28_7]